MLLKAADIDHGDEPYRWIGWARELDQAPEFRPTAMPKPRPPLMARPKSLSFTEIETLIRDPYAIYARRILRLEPLAGIAEPADAALRGQLIHDALNLFARTYPEHLPVDAADELIRLGREVFAPHLGEAEVAGFWWPRFLRIAPWFLEQDRLLRQGVAHSVSEVSAALDLDVAGEVFKLTGRADRIDIFGDGTARIVDYKTGEPPSVKQVEIGLAPQLTLEAAALEQGGFADLPPIETQDLLYVRLSGGEPPGKLVPVASFPVMATARVHLAKLRGLLIGYASETAAYIPRHIMKTESDTSPYDHLSRWGEWARKEAVE
jgi:ATP-dependent helicase/nuclease subunit B